MLRSTNIVIVDELSGGRFRAVLTGKRIGDYVAIANDPGQAVSQVWAEYRREFPPLNPPFEVVVQSILKASERLSRPGWLVSQRMRR